MHFYCTITLALARFSCLNKDIHGTIERLLIFYYAFFAIIV